uniref:DSBA-like thioredoxin domain-containing protein n=1 Tax=Panagrolaimus sp. ES5 TaxID=591445 RepID=A0AC34G6P0_9BILA
MNTIGHKIPYYEKTLRDYNFYEVKTLGKIYGLNVNPPEDAFEKLSNTGTFCTQRFLAAVQESSPEYFEPACREAWKRLWSQNLPVHSDTDFKEICQDIGIDQNIMNLLSDDKWTLKINENNYNIIQQKCFGVPWISVRKSDDQNETFFGADRLPLVFRFLEECDRKRLAID